MERSMFGSDSMERRFQSVYPCKSLIKHSHPAGYVYLHLPKHPFADSCGNVFEHRAVVEQAIGRFLYPTEVVHHRNRNRSDNSLKNLQVIINQQVHMQLEHSSLKDTELVQKVLAAAPDPNISLSDLDCSPATARKICAHFDVEWISAAHSNLDEGRVRTLLLTGDNKAAAKSLGVSVSTLRRNYPHLFKTTRPKPGFLEKNKDAILRLRKSGRTYEQIADLYSTNKVTIGAALRRWQSGVPMKLGRKRVNFLDEHSNTVFGMLRAGHKMMYIAEHFATSVITVREQLYRWKSAGSLPADIDQLVCSRMRRKHTFKLS